MAKKQASVINAKAAREETDSEVVEDVGDDSGTLDNFEEQADHGLNESDFQTQARVNVINRETTNSCESPCCVNDTVAYQPTDKTTLQLLSSNKRNFQPALYKRYPSLAKHLLVKKKVFVGIVIMVPGFYLAKLVNNKQHSPSQVSIIEKQLGNGNGGHAMRHECTYSSSSRSSSPQLSIPHCSVSNDGYSETLSQSDTASDSHDDEAGPGALWHPPLSDQMTSRALLVCRLLHLGRHL